MKIAFFSDLHAEMGHDPDRLGDFTRALHWTTDYIVGREDVCRVICAGDLFDHRAAVDTRVIYAVADELEYMASHLSLDVLGGNHDMATHRGLENLIDPILPEGATAHTRHEDDKVDIELIESEHVSITYLPHYADRQMSERLCRAATRVPDGWTNILVGHFFLEGLLPSDRPPEEEVDAKLLDAWDQVLLGHYHVPSPTWVSGQGRELGHIHYLGSMIPLEMGDGSARGIVIFDTSNGSAEFIEVPAPRFIQVTDPADIPSEDTLRGNYFKGKFGHGVKLSPDQEARLGACRRHTVTNDPGVAVEHRIETSATDADLIVEYLRTHDKPKEWLVEAMQYMERK